MRWRMTRSLRFSRMVFRGGHEDFERGMAFFLPDYMEEAELKESEHIRAIKLTAAFGEPAHRDYMGAVLGMGVNREWVGDIIVDGCTAYVLCQPSVLRHLLSIDKVGRCGVRAEEIALSELPHKARQSEERSFTLMSLRLDALCSRDVPYLAHRGRAADRRGECEPELHGVPERRQERQGGGHRLAARRGQGQAQGAGRQLQ